MNLLLIRESEQEGERVRLRGERAKHVREVLKLAVGERMRVGLARESEGSAQIAGFEGDEVLLDSLQLDALKSPPALRLVLALPRPKALRRTLQTAASFGVDHIDLVNAWRVSKSYWSSPALSPSALESELRLGCEQGRHAWLPSISCHRLLVPFVEDLESDKMLQCIAHPGSETWFSDIEQLGGPIRLAVGPEGGWVEAELKSFADAGFQQVSVSRSILRTEIALAAALAQYELSNRSSRG